MHTIIKKILLGVPILQKWLARSTSWLIREKYSQVNEDDFRRLIKYLTATKSHGLTLRRYGSEFDGGYILADLGIKYERLVSFGVGDNIEFEASLAKEVGSIDLYDHTVAQLPVEIENGTFFKIGLSSTCTRQFVSLECATPKNSQNSILKIDIEGDEWESLHNINLRNLDSYAQIVLELHDLLEIDNPATLKIYVDVLENLHRNHKLVFVHGNNWSQVQIVNGYLFADVLEVTFVRKDLVTPGEQIPVYLDSLHSPNNPNNADLRMNF